MQSSSARPRLDRTRQRRLAASLMMLSLPAGRAPAQQPSARDSRNPTTSTVTTPLDAYIREAIRANPSLAQDVLDEDHAVAAVREARSQHFPSLAFSSRRTRVDGGLDLGNLVNPAYRALNQITGTSSFPTNIGLTLPFAQETRVRLAQPIYQPAIGAGVRAADAARDAQSAAVRAAARQLAAQVQTSYWAVASADRVAELYRMTLPLVDENVRVNERLLANGTATPDAVLRARADRSEVAQQLDRKSTRLNSSHI